MRDRLCFGQLDAFSLACVDDTPPLHCYCEPYDCLWKRSLGSTTRIYGYETAMWCQRYELFCNEKERRRKGTDLVSLMHDTVRVHYRWFKFVNKPNLTYFLFDCELITEWDEEQTERKGSTFIEGNNLEKQEKSKTLTPSSEDIKLANKLAEEERLLEKLVKEREKEEKKVSGLISLVFASLYLSYPITKFPLYLNLKHFQNSTKSEVASLVTEHGVTDNYHIKSSIVLSSQMIDKNQQHTTSHPFSKIMLAKMNDT
uniref:Uncharacterized protein n=1 Tax=Heterorhabditis bacteriophora TaxID=37862 RepID=A0A1I7X270_HETBA